MTPEDWFAAIEPASLMRAFREGPSLSKRQQELHARRLRLFACAAVRQVWNLLANEARSAVQTSERFAQGRATLTDLLAVAIRSRNNWVTAEQLALASALGATSLPQEGLVASTFNAEEGSRNAARAVAIRDVGPAPPGRPTTNEWHAAWNAAFSGARAVQADYFRDIFPPPDYKANRDPQWLTSTVLALARQMDESGDFSAVPILADALQDAGCEDETILKSCRAKGNNHVRGNWVVELVLGRS
jgi:hypothetical protein